MNLQEEDAGKYSLAKFVKVLLNRNFFFAPFFMQYQILTDYQYVTQFAREIFKNKKCCIFSF